MGGGGQSETRAAGPTTTAKNMGTACMRSVQHACAVLHQRGCVCLWLGEGGWVFVAWAVDAAKRGQGEVMGASGIRTAQVAKATDKRTQTPTAGGTSSHIRHTKTNHEASQAGRGNRWCRAATCGSYTGCPTHRCTNDTETRPDACCDAWFPVSCPHRSHIVVPACTRRTVPAGTSQECCAPHLDHSPANQRSGGKRTDYSNTTLRPARKRQEEQVWAA